MANTEQKSRKVEVDDIESTVCETIEDFLRPLRGHTLDVGIPYRIPVPDDDWPIVVVLTLEPR